MRAAMPRVFLLGTRPIRAIISLIGENMPGWLVSNDMWKDVFVLGAPVLEKILRPVLVYIFLVGALRVFGKRELAQLNPFDLVVLLSLSNTVQNAIIGN